MKILTTVAFKGIVLAYILSVLPAYASEADGDISKALAATDKRSCIKAFSLLDSAMKKTPNDYQVFMRTGAIYVRCGKRQQSMQYYVKGISLAKHETLQSLYIKGDIAVAYRAIGSYANAISYGKEAAKLSKKAGDEIQVTRMEILIADLESRKIVGQL
jgi:tetratricopeptide (TPR) repeat protein